MRALFVSSHCTAACCAAAAARLVLLPQRVVAFGSVSSAASSSKQKPRRRRATHTTAAAAPGTAAAEALQGLLPDTAIGTAVAAAVRAVGRTPGADEQALAERLQDNLYTTAGDVACMSQEELELLHVPVKLWALLRDQLQAAASEQQPVTQPPGSGDTRTSSSSSSSPVAGQQPLPVDIMQRRMPPVDCRRLASAPAVPESKGRRQAVRTTPLKRTEPYGLQERDMTPALLAELAQLERFTTSRWFGQLAEPLLPVTYRTVTLHYVKLLLGYLLTIKGVPLGALSLASVVPSAGREGVSVLMEYQHWRSAQRGTAASTATLPIKAAVHVARFLFHDQAKPPSETKARPYHDLPVVQELAVLQRGAQKEAAGAERVADEGRKWLAWGDYLQLVAALRAECAGLTVDGRPRVRAQVALSLQRYLIAAILSVVPDRQRTLRELEVGRTLLRREGDGAWVIKHSAGDYKTGKQYGDRPPLVLAPFIYPELEAYINTWRHELGPRTPKLFCKPQTGQALSEDDVYRTLRRAALRLTGKATNPHCVRDMIVTHAKMQRKSESEMEALALYMGHSLAMQRSTYDRRSKAQKVGPAVELLQGLWG